MAREFPTELLNDYYALLTVRRQGKSKCKELAKAAVEVW